MAIRWLCLMPALLSACWSGARAEELRPAALLPDAALPRPADIDPPAAEAVEESIRRGVDFLVQDQNANGSWGSAERTKGLNVYAPVPGAHHAFRAATTALTVSALIAGGDDRPEVAEAIDRGEQWLLEHLPSLRRATPVAIYNIWGHAYGIRALVALRGLRADDSDRVAELDRQIARQIDLLARYEAAGGGWGYYDFGAGTQRPNASANSFTTSTVLIALFEAQQAGHDMPGGLIERGLRSVRQQQKPDYTYLYSVRSMFRPMGVIHRPGGSLARSQVCNLALRMAGDEQITDEVLIVWLDRLFARSLWLDIGRKRPRPHEAYFLVAGYFYYYGHYYAAGCLGLLPDGEQRERLRAHLAATMLEKQEQDGSWWDFPLYNYHQQYGTAMAVMTLVGCR